MKIPGNFKDKNFWIKVIRLGGIFFILLVVISMVFANAGAFFSGDFASVIEQEWGHGKWKTDIPIKLLITLVYSIVMVSSGRWSKT